MLGLCMDPCGMRSQAGGLFWGVPLSRSRPGGGCRALQPLSAQAALPCSFRRIDVWRVSSWMAFGGLFQEQLRCNLSSFVTERGAAG